MYVILSEGAVKMIEIMTFENKTSIVITDAKGKELELIESARALQPSADITYENTESNETKESKMSTSVFAKFKCNQKPNTVQSNAHIDTVNKDTNNIKAPVKYNENEKIKDILKGEYPNKRRNIK